MTKMLLIIIWLSTAIQLSAQGPHPDFNQRIEYHGVVLGQPLTIKSVTIHTDCINLDNLQNVATSIKSRAEHLALEAEQDYQSGKRFSICTYGSGTQDGGPVTGISVKTREVPQLVIRRMIALYGNPVDFDNGITIWLWRSPTAGTKRIVVKAIVAEDPQTLEQFVTTEITFEFFHPVPSY